MRFTGGVFRDYGENHLARREILQAFFAGDQLTLWREDGGDPHQVLGGYPGISQGQFERSQAFFVLPDALGQKQTFRDHAFSQSVTSR